mmetsp:Transcript_10657/g.22606  ORF Transcript_10657/g.22606 Transcript_10657/m.22606 type:complete len:277 (-) Transcript_10657:16-846(-)
MRRTNQLAATKLKHVSWNSDAQTVRFSQQKGDQSGERPTDARHVYANPFDISLCSVLALAVYFSCVEGEAGSVLHFGGGSQEQRFRRLLARALDELHSRRTIGSQVDCNLGAHSLRKGVATLNCSGSTAGTSIISVCLRCSWSIGGVQARYFRYEAAGDQFVGLAASGLPVNTQKFGVLPPHFQTSNEVGMEVIKLQFPRWNTGAGSEENEQSYTQLRTTVFPFLLASLVRHFPLLDRLLGPRHPLCFSFLCRLDSARREALASLLNTDAFASESV